MPDAGALEKYYETLTDAQLLNLRTEGGFTEQAEQVLADELKRRNLRASDVKRYAVPERIKLCEEVQEKGFAGRGPTLRFFGRRYLNEADKTANIQLRTKWFALGGIPIVPLASYRFKCTGTPSKWFGGGHRAASHQPRSTELAPSISDMGEDRDLHSSLFSSRGRILLVSGSSKAVVLSMIRLSSSATN